MKHTHYIIILLLIFSFTHLTAQIRYVSKTGSSTPPYTSWATASDSIQKCIEYCSNGDTIIIANGEYKETLLITRAVTIIGSSMDSTVIDGRGLNGHLINYVTIHLQSDCTLSNLKIKGKSQDVGNETIIIAPIYNLLNLTNSKLEHSNTGIYTGSRSHFIKDNIFSEMSLTCLDIFSVDSSFVRIENNIFNMTNRGYTGIWNDFRGNLTVTNNIFLLKNSHLWETGIDFRWYFNSAKVKNNLVFNSKNTSMSFYPSSDTLEITNNATLAGKEYNIIAAGPGIAKIRNNIITKSKKGLQTNGQSSDYNLFWQNENNTTGSAVLGENDIIADPMFVNDSLPDLSKADLRLQMFSPAIDAGDPEILDVNGSRSDIGLFGGPLGKAYKYIDYPPRPPKNILPVVDLDSMKVSLSWNKNTESDFSCYRIYRDTTAFTQLDSSRLIAVSDSSFYEDINLPGKSEKLYYRVTAVDNQDNESASVELITVVITGVDEFTTGKITDYYLYQNYPNPFNGTTVIGYSLKERASVRILIYDIKGELLGMIMNEEKEKGYYEKDFNPGLFNGGLSSGIYLYRVEIIDGGGIPRYADMKKMIYLK